MYRFLICDDHALMRQALQMSIERRWPVSQITCVASFPEAWAAISHGFDLCICDLKMPGSDPLVGLGKLVALLGPAKILVISGNCETDTIRNVLALGVHGIFDKAQDGDMLDDAVSAVLEGSLFIPTDVCDQVAPSKLPRHTASISNGNDKAQMQLTAQQTQVLSHMCKGQTNKQIALRMGVAPSTIKFHVDQILKRLSAKNRAEAVSIFLSLNER